MSEIVTEDNQAITSQWLYDRLVISQAEDPPVPNIILDRANATRLRDRLNEVLGKDDPGRSKQSRKGD